MNIFSRARARVCVCVTAIDSWLFTRKGSMKVTMINVLCKFHANIQ